MKTGLLLGVQWSVSIFSPLMGLGLRLTSTVKQYTDIQAAITPPQPSSEIIETLNAIHARVGALVQQPLLHAAIAIDGRNSTIRKQETNMGNMLADAIRAFYNTDIGLFNSGAIRLDRVLKETVSTGEPLLVRDIIGMPDLPPGNGNSSPTNRPQHKTSAPLATRFSSNA